MSTLKVNDITDAAGTGPVGFSKGVNLTYGVEVRAAQGTNFVLTTASAHLQLVTPTASITCTLPANVKAGEVFTIRNLAAASTGFTIQILADNGSLIRTVYPSGGPGDVVALQDNADVESEWEGISIVMSDWILQTATVSDATNVNNRQIIWRRIGSDILASFYVTWNGVGAGSNFSVSLPGSLTWKSPWMGSSTDNPIGGAQFYGASSVIFMSYADTGTNTIRFLQNTGNVTFDGSQAVSGNQLSAQIQGQINGWSITKG